jgi:hypothetical protein
LSTVPAKKKAVAMKLGFVTESEFDRIVDPANPMIQVTTSLPQCTKLLLNFIFLGQFQIGLPPQWIAIILHTSGIGPVGVSQCK